VTGDDDDDDDDDDDNNNNNNVDRGDWGVLLLLYKNKVKMSLTIKITTITVVAELFGR
jgi:hypothetical protein